MRLRGRLSDAGTAARGPLAGRMPAAGLAGAMQGWLAGLPMPSAPATETWTLSIGNLLLRGGGPPVAGKALVSLDRFGRVSIGPDHVGIDGEDVAWGTVTAVRTSPPVTALLSQDVVRREVERVKRLVPPMPGRSLVLARIGTVLGDLLGRALSGGALSPGTVVSAVESTGRLGRQKIVDVGLTAALVLMATPEVGYARSRPQHPGHGRAAPCAGDGRPVGHAVGRGDRSVVPAAGRGGARRAVARRRPGALTVGEGNG